MSFLTELKRRNVFRVGVAYLVTAWVLLQVVDLVLDNIPAPDWIMQVFMLALAIGFPLVLVLAWVFELTPDGVKRDSEVSPSASVSAQTGRKLDRWIIAVLLVAVCLLLADRLLFRSPATEALLTTETGQLETAVSSTNNPAEDSGEGRNSVAVLPFVAMSNGPDDEYFADGLTEEILNSLAQLPELLVTARTSAFHFKGRDLPIQEIADTLGVDNVVEGSVRREGERLRITAQLVRAKDGFHIWSETYDRTTEDSFKVQADIAAKIALALDVVLDDRRLAAMREAGVGNPEAFIEFQKGVKLYELAHGTLEQIPTLARANQHFERATELEPGLTDAYMAHSDYFTHILLAAAGGSQTPGITPQLLEAAPGALRSDFEAAARSASDLGRRLNAEFDLALLMGKWRGISALVDRVFEPKGCGVPMWIHNVTAAFGKPRELLLDYQRLLECDPLGARARVHMVRGNIWLGDFDAAIDSAIEGMGLANHEWVLDAYVSALIAAGRFDEAEAVVKRDFRNDKNFMLARINVAAARGDRAQAESFWQEYQSSFDPRATIALSVPAIIGDRAQANLLAADIDSQPFGYAVLIGQIYVCACGAPFDLEATPDFAARLTDSGLPWPPKSPIKYPLKNW